MFLSLGTGFGCLITLSSYNKFNRNILRDVILIVVGLVAHSIITSCMVFTLVSGLASKWKRDVSYVIQEGHNGRELIFGVTMEALSEVGPVPQIPIFMFSLMLLVLSLTPVMIINETLVTALTDHFPSLRQHRSKVQIHCL